MIGKRVAILGAGLQGACIALELASRGVAVDLYERNAICLGEASAHNEGKVHLGFVYAGDETLKTARLMTKGALCFQPLLRRWLGHGIDEIPVSSCFHYVIHRASLIEPANFASYARRVSEVVAEGMDGKTAHYFGQDPIKPPRRLRADKYDGPYDPAAAAAVFETSEIGIDPEAMGSKYQLADGAKRRPILVLPSTG